MAEVFPLLPPDLYLGGGIGAVSTRPVAVVDPENRTFSYKAKVAFHAVLGARLFLTPWLAANLEVRDVIYHEQRENQAVAPPGGVPSATDPRTWIGETRLTNSVQVSLGLSVFIPAIPAPARR